LLWKLKKIMVILINAMEIRHFQFISFGFHL
jgi:hypothetical protein